MDQTVIAAIVGGVVTTVGGVGTALYQLAKWLGIRLDKVIDRHELFLDRLEGEIPWKREKLDAIHDDLKEVHEVVVPRLSDRPSAFLNQRANEERHES